MRNQYAVEIFKEYFNQLRQALIVHQQWSEASPFHEHLPRLAKEVKRLSYLVEAWRVVAKRNETAKRGHQ